MHQYRMIILLEDFNTDDDTPLPNSLKLDHGWELVSVKNLKLPNGTLEHFGKLASPLHQQKLLGTEFALINEFELDASKINNFTETDEFRVRTTQSQWIGIALRLIRPGYFVIHRITLRKDDEPWHAVQSSLVSDKYYQPTGFDPLDDLYSISDENKIKSYSKYLIELAAAQEGRHHRVLNALDLFNEALKQFRYDTKLILMVSAIESLFNFSQGQTTEKIAFGTSRFIESDTSKRVKLYNEVKDLYTVRSYLIHGSRLGKIRKQNFYANIPLQNEIARLAYSVITKSLDRIIANDLADDFNNSALLAKEYTTATLGQKSHIFLETDSYLFKNQLLLANVTCSNWFVEQELKSK